MPLLRGPSSGDTGSAGGASGRDMRAYAEHAGGLSLHGQNAARRQAITELLFFASVGDLSRCQRICNTWKIDVRARARVPACRRWLGRICGSSARNTCVRARAMRTRLPSAGGSGGGSDLVPWCP